MGRKRRGGLHQNACPENLLNEIQSLLNQEIANNKELLNDNNLFQQWWETEQKNFEIGTDISKLPKNQRKTFFDAYIYCKTGYDPNEREDTIEALKKLKACPKKRTMRRRNASSLDDIRLGLKCFKRSKKGFEITKDDKENYTPIWFNEEWNLLFCEKVKQFTVEEFTRRWNYLKSEPKDSTKFIQGIVQGLKDTTPEGAFHGIMYGMIGSSIPTIIVIIAQATGLHTLIWSLVGLTVSCPPFLASVFVGAAVGFGAYQLYKFYSAIKKELDKKTYRRNYVDDDFQEDGSYLKTYPYSSYLETYPYSSYLETYPYSSYLETYPYSSEKGIIYTLKF